MVFFSPKTRRITPFVFACSLTLVLFLSTCAPAPGVKEIPLRTVPNAIDINRATATELQKLPGIGKKTALRIVLHREEFGRFRKPEHIMLVEGIAETQYTKIESLIRTD